MVSGEKEWDPLHAGLIQPHLSGQSLDTRIAPAFNQTYTSAKDTAFNQSQRLSLPLSSLVRKPFHPVQVTSLHLKKYHRTEGPHKPVVNHRVDSHSGKEKKEQEVEDLPMKSKRFGQGDAMMEDQLDDISDGPKNAKITLSFPLSAAPLPSSITSPNHCSSSSSASPSPQRRRPSTKSSDKGSLWKLDATTDVKHRPYKPHRHDSSPSSSPSSSSSPMTVHSFIRKDIKSPPQLKCSKFNSETQFQRSPHRILSGSLGGCFSGEEEGGRLRITNGTASPSQTAQILFSIGTSAYQRGRDAEKREKITKRPGGKVVSPRGPSLHPPTLHHPPPLPPAPPPPSEGLAVPLHTSPYPSTDSLNQPELICGVCHRLFSSASSLTVHMRLHRGSRALYCHYCGKVFIHSKRLQSHEASCRMQGLPSKSLRPPSLTVQPKEEPLEEGEVRVEGGVIVGETDISKARPGKKAQSLLERIQGDDAAGTELLTGDENHFVKVVDGNVIYFCSVCERSYMTLSSLKRHSNVHSWRRKYPCHYCDKVFALAEYRTKHEVWHTGERRYQCIFCWDAFATYYNLKTHQKSIHGINPSLISSEKTANGGYKQKANALKLYRLLPMRSQKRPYKTYSDSLHNGLLLPPNEASSLSLSSLGCGLDPGDLQSFIEGAHPQSVKPDPDAFSDSFPISVADEHTDLSALTSHPQTDKPQVKKSKSKAVESEQKKTSGSYKMSNISKTKPLKTGKDPETSMPSVITYGHTKPSVIVHGTAVSSSVIVHSNQVSSGSEKSQVDCSSENCNNLNLLRSCPKATKKQRDSADSLRKRSRESYDTAEEGSRDREDTETGRLFHKSRKSHSKSYISASKQLPASPGSQVKEAGPLCQITVRIGEEAIVKRSISETDLRRDKGLSPPKTKRSEASERDTKESRQSHSHHHHKHRLQSRAMREVEEAKGKGHSGEKEEVLEEEEEEEKQEEELRKKTAQSLSEVRGYNFRQEVREQESDQDMEDNLWRPYYSYKPKRKAQAHLQRVKSWQRKLKYKRSIRLKHRAERLKTLMSKETQKSQDKKGERKSKEPEKMTKTDINGGEGKEKDNLSDTITKKIMNAEKHSEETHDISPHPLLFPKLSLSTSAVPAGTKRRPWTNINAAECGTCGRWFSSSRKRDKHELSHLLEFVCMFCRATFPSRDKLEDHQHAQHPKPAEGPSAPPGVDKTEGSTIKSVPDVAKIDEDKGGQIGFSGRSSSPSRLNRRALSRHTCSQCHKVCKTSSALTRHIRRHELSSCSEKEREDKDQEQNITKTFFSKPDQQSENRHTPTTQSVSVINYLTTEPPRNSCLATQQPKDIRVEHRFEHQMSNSSLKSEKRQSPVQEPKPQIEEPPFESPVNPTPNYTTPTPSSVQSVLVMNGPECLDYRTPSKKKLDRQTYRIPSPGNSLPSTDVSPNLPVTAETRITIEGTPSVSMTTVSNPELGFIKRDGVIMDREWKVVNNTFQHASYEKAPQVQDHGVQSSSRSPSPEQAQDLTMSSILAREREIDRQKEKEKELEKQREKEIQKERKIVTNRVQMFGGHIHSPQEQTALLVPKEEPLSPVPSPQHVTIQATVNSSSSQRQSPKSSCRSPSNIGSLSQPNCQIHSPSHGLDRLTLPTVTAGAAERPSAQALLLPRAPQPPEMKHQDTVSSRDLLQRDTTPMDYLAHEYQLPFIVPDSYHSGKKPGESLIMSSYPHEALPFGTLGKVMVPNSGDLAKLPFYPDPYQLLYGPQLLAYPYNLAALPVALNMMTPGTDKVEPLPFLPAIFNYATTAGPYMGASPHPLVANPSLYTGSSSAKKQRESSSSSSKP